MNWKLEYWVKEWQINGDNEVEEVITFKDRTQTPHIRSGLQTFFFEISILSFCFCEKKEKNFFFFSFGYESNQ